ncbi:MAG: L-lactate MFS transporter [Brevibacterium yomogidense]|uniref:Major facilitator superfamily MFS_1 n=1 Tax=Brevibacterium yomogidense TaxID=946573 RepID=A0A1X6WVU5_9MICO|nr:MULTISPECIES: OFA family MFS transporter [Brevibacterium]SLM89595.1 major facilitator superfamily MFS_1 [Brevibacterium yomogidense]SMX79739.1 Nitrate/nitrite transporter NarK [Brevibacterium sp. Mu109]
MSVLDREAIIAPVTFNRWLIPPAALAIHLSIGQAYAFSVFKNPLAEHFGMGEGGDVAIGWIFSLAIAMLGISSAIGGTWVERAGPRKSMVVAGSFWVVGFFVATAGIAMDQLWLVYLGYGVIGGIGLGIGYISPVSTLMKWFPDRPGLATGLAIMGFGGGALIASPASNALMVFFGGGPDSMADGIMQTFLTLAVLYLVVIAMGAYVIRLPHPDWKPKGYDPEKAASKPLQTTGSVSANQALKTPQFWFLWVALFTNVTAGIGILESASPMIQSSFGITAVAAGGYVGLLSLTNMGGRFIWSTVSDYIGRKNIYILYLGVGAGLYFVLASFGSQSIALFVVSTLIILSFYGGGFSTVPAYLKDLFGVYQVGAIHGRLLTAWSAAGVAGPLLVNSIVESSRSGGGEGFELYRVSLFIMAGILVVGLAGNLLIRPVAEKHFSDSMMVASKREEDREAASEAAVAHQQTAAGGAGAVHTTVAIVLAVVVVGSLLYGLGETAVRAAALFVG